MKTIKYSVEYKKPADRMELFVRLIWLIPASIVLLILGFIAKICIILQFFHVLFLGKRHQDLHHWIEKYVTYSVELYSYILLTDERPELIPKF